MRFCDVTGKTIHKSANSARRGVTRGNEGYPYRCPHCSGWHVSHWRGELMPKKKWAKLAFGERK